MAVTILSYDSSVCPVVCTCQLLANYNVSCFNEVKCLEKDKSTKKRKKEEKKKEHVECGRANIFSVNEGALEQIVEPLGLRR